MDNDRMTTMISLPGTDCIFALWLSQNIKNKYMVLVHVNRAQLLCNIIFKQAIIYGNAKYMQNTRHYSYAILDGQVEHL